MEQNETSANPITVHLTVGGISATACGLLGGSYHHSVNKDAVNCPLCIAENGRIYSKISGISKRIQG